MASVTSKLKAILFNIFFVTVPAVVLLVLALEAFARLVLPVSDYPATTFDPLLGNVYSPHQTGIYVRGSSSQIRAKYSINANGWNSPRDYIRSKADGVSRISVIGDSYIEAFQVDFSESYPYLIEERLNQETSEEEFQVYTHGHSGASLAQYLRVLRHAAIELAPDLVIVNIVHNDFKESLFGYGRKDNWTLEFDGASFVEVPPRPVNNLSIKQWARKFALARYCILNLSLQRKLRFIHDLLSGDTRRYVANIETQDFDVFEDESSLDDMLAFVFGRMKEITDSSDAALLLVVDGHRGAIYRGEDPRRARLSRFNSAVQRIAREFDISTLDLTEAFERDWSEHGELFDWPDDRHWNGRGHRVVADAVIHWLRGSADQLEDDPRPQVNEVAPGHAAAVQD